MRQWGQIKDGLDRHATVDQRTNGALATGTRPTNADFRLLESKLSRLLHAPFHRQLSGERRRLAAALVPDRTSRFPGSDFAIGVTDRDDGVVEGGVDVDDAGADRLLDLFLILLTFIRLRL